MIAFLMHLGRRDIQRLKALGSVVVELWQQFCMWRTCRRFVHPQVGGHHQLGKTASLGGTDHAQQPRVLAMSKQDRSFVLALTLRHALLRSVLAVGCVGEQTSHLES